MTPETTADKSQYLFDSYRLYVREQLHRGGANQKARQLLYDADFVVEAYHLSSARPVLLIDPRFKCGPAADLLEENGYSEHAKLFR